jgi:putative colanic acid biosynthesis acetyltransferase WcaF
MTTPGTQIDLSKSITKWSWKTKITRGLWNLAWLFLFRPTPKRMGNRWRIRLIRRFGADIKGAYLLPACRILQPWKLHLGNNVVIGADVEIYNYADVTVGDMTVISQYSYLCTGTHDYTLPDMPLIWAPITIGSECWIAAGVFIAPGVTIGDGAVIGARSVVTKDMPAWTVCAGNPCRPLKPRIMKSSENSVEQANSNQL